MDRAIDIKKTKFIIREMNLGEISLDKLQCEKLILYASESDPSVTLIFSIKGKSTLVFGDDDIEDFRENTGKFDDLQISDEYIITRIYKLLKSNSSWDKYPKFVRFTSNGIDCKFSVRFEGNGRSHLRIIRKNSIDQS